MSYNGFSNYETWSAHLWLTNDSQELAELAIETASQGADALKTLLEDCLEIENHSPIVQQFLNSAVAEIDFNEIVESLLAD